MIFVIEYHYFPAISFYASLFNCSNIIFEQYENYQKMSFRNRCIISGANGPISLSIPLVSGREQKTLISKVRVSDSISWQQSHWKTILSCYNRSPWFEYYRGELESLYKKRFVFLVDWNMACFEWVTRQLSISIGVQFSDNFADSYDPSLYADFRNKLLPKNYRNFGSPVYEQVFRDRQPFMPNLSILDLLCCEGTEAIPLLRDWRGRSGERE